MDYSGQVIQIVGIVRETIGFSGQNKTTACRQGRHWLPKREGTHGVGRIAI